MDRLRSHNAYVRIMRMTIRSVLSVKSMFNTAEPKPVSPSAIRMPTTISPVFITFHKLRILQSPSEEAHTSHCLESH